MLLPVRTQQRHMLHNRQPGLRETAASSRPCPCPQPRTQHARAHIRNPRQLEQPLNRPVLAKRPVQHRKNHVDRRRRPRCPWPERPFRRAPAPAASESLPAAAWLPASPPDRPHADAAPPRSRRPRSSWVASAAASQWPSLVMPIGTTSNFLRSIAFRIEAAESSETSCSPLRPPNRTPTRSFFSYSLLSLTWMRKDGAG